MENNMKLPEPLSRQFETIMNDILSGQTKIPQFQRDFVWELKKSTHLMDSIVKGYPIGTFIFWRTKERLKVVRNIGNIELPEPDEGEFVDFVLDGQQRLTSIFASLKGLKITRNNGKIDDFSQMYIDLDASYEDQIVISEISNKNKETYILLNDLLYGGLTKLAQFDSKYHQKIEDYKNRIKSYSYSIICNVQH
jgi:uncharacterized protein with ParB-like and HNH nuclease domain